MGKKRAVNGHSQLKASAADAQQVFAAFIGLAEDQRSEFVRLCCEAGGENEVQVMVTFLIRQYLEDMNASAAREKAHALLHSRMLRSIRDLVDMVITGNKDANKARAIAEKFNRRGKQRNKERNKKIIELHSQGMSDEQISRNPEIIRLGGKRIGRKAVEQARKRAMKISMQ